MQYFVWLVLIVLMFSPASLAREVVPKVGIYMTKEEIAEARILAQTRPFANTEKNRIMAKANEWLHVSDDYIREIIPKPGAIFAYGIAGCPDHNVSWANFGGNNIADLKRPFILRCPAGHDIDFNNPDSKYYDSGNGVWINNVRYFFRGVYNAYVVNTFTGWGSDEGVLHTLAYAYVITGDDIYAEKAAVIFDALAYLSPTTKGPRDFNSNDKAITGRMHFLTSIVHRSKVHFARSFDLLYNNPAMQKKSFYNDKTIAENVASGLLLDYMFAEFDLREGKLSTLHNHESDELRGMLATGLVLGIPEYIRWGLQGASYFFENTIDKDGLYYEGSPAYANFTQRVFSDIAELAYYYNPDNYDLDNLPARVNFYDHPKLREFFYGLRDKLDIAGHYASFGNASSDRKRIEVDSRRPDKDEVLYVDLLYHRTEIPELKEKYYEKLVQMTQGDPDAFRSGAWALFHIKPETETKKSLLKEVDQATTAYYSGPSLAILGLGEGRYRRGLLMRGGPNLPHSHDDALALYYYDKGYLLTQDNGYYIFGSPLHSGWGSQAVSHNLVVVDNDRYRNGWYKNTPGANLYGFADLPGIKYVHLDNPKQFSASAYINEYSRRTALIELNATESYVFDVFTVEGGKRHDYVFHTAAMILESEVKFNSLPNVWTLAGLDDPLTTYNEPGKSWGERIMPGDMIRDLGLASEGVKSMYWNPPPGNGYGFIYQLEKGELEGDNIEARFKIYDGTDTTLTNRLFFDQKTELYKGLGPNLAGTEKYPYLILRSESEKKHASRVISIMDASFGLSPILSVNRLDSNSFVIQTLEGDKHYILLNGGSANTPLGRFSSEAELALAIFKGENLERVAVIGPGSAILADIQLDAKETASEITKVDWTRSEVSILGDIEVSKGDMVTINNSQYSRNSAYLVKDVRKEKGKTILVLEGSMVLAKGTVAKGTKNLSLNVPLPTGFSYESSTKYLDGKIFVGERTGESETIRALSGFKNLSLRSALSLESGDEFAIYDVKPGDILKTLPNKVLNR